MTTQNTNKPSEFFTLGVSLATSNVKLSKAFEAIRQQSDDHAVLSVSEILRGAASVGEKAFNDAEKAYKAACKAKNAEAIKKALDAKEQALDLKKALINKAWTACRQYTSKHVRNGNTIQYKGGVVKWLAQPGNAGAANGKTVSTAKTETAKTEDKKAVSPLEQAKTLVKQLTKAERDTLAAFLITLNVKQAARKSAKTSKPAPKRTGTNG